MITEGTPPRRLCNIPKVSVNGVEPGIQTISDFDYGWLAFFSNKICMSIGIFRVSTQYRACIFSDY